MASYSASDLIISAFPAGNEIWQVDWFGQIDYPNPIERHRQASVCVSLSRALAAGVFSPPAEPVSCWVSVGILVVLRVGSRFQNRRFVGVGGGEQETFTDIDVGAPDVELIKTGSSVNGHFLLPLFHHPGHRAHTKGFCVCVPLSDGRRLIVPCMELVRFYFGSSSALLSKLLQPGLRRDDLYESERSRVGAGLTRSHLYLAANLTGRCATDVARIAGDLAAWRSAVSIGMSMASQHNQGYVRTSFPFSGRTTLKARGQWLPLGNVARQTFVVHELLHCLHPLPFKRLKYHTSPLAGKKGQAKASKRPNSAEEHRSDSSAGKTSTLVEKDAGPFGSQLFRFSDSQRFPDLANKPVYRKRVDSNDEPLMVSSASIHDLALGRAGSEDRVRPAELEAAPMKEVPAFLQPIIEVLADISDLSLRPLTNAGEDGWSVPLEECIVGLSDEQRYLPRASEHSGRLLRRVSVLHLALQAWTQACVVIEYDRLVIASYPVVGASDQECLEACRLQLTNDFEGLVSRTITSTLEHEEPGSPARTESNNAAMMGLLKRQGLPLDSPS